MPFKIIANDDLELSAGDFGESVGTDELAIPRKLNGVLRRYNLRTAEQLVSYLHVFPRALAIELGWSVDDLQQAQRKLVSKLQGNVDREILEPPEAPAFGYGALDPRGRE